MFKSLKAKLVAVNVLLVLLPTLIVIAMAHFVVEEMKGTIQQGIRENAWLQATAIDLWLAERSHEITEFALAVGRVNMNPEESQKLAEAFMANCGEKCASFVVVGLDGVIVADFNKETVGSLNLSEIPDFQKAINGDVVITDMVYSDVTQEWIMSFFAPVRSDSGEIIGAVLMPVATSYISELLQSVNTSETSDAYLVSQEGKFVTEPRFWTDIAPDDTTSFTEVAVGTEGAQKVAAGQTGNHVYTNYQQQQVVGAYQPLSQNNWGLVLELHTSEVYQTVNTIQVVSLIVLGVIVVVVIVMSIVAANGVVDPIKMMTFALQNMSYGDLNRDIPAADKQAIINRGDEIGAIGEALRASERYLTNMAEAAEQLSRGNLAIEIIPNSEKDELGHAFAKMIVGLRELVGQVTSSAHSVGAASGQLAATTDQASLATNQIATTIQQIAHGTAQQTENVNRASTIVSQVSHTIVGVAQGTQEQAGAVTTSADITNQMALAIQKVTTNAQAGAESAATAAQTARDGSVTINATIQGMDAIKDKVGLSVQKVQEMGQRSTQIGAIVQTIDDIASQTNLLALNAAIEAARAGEHGKGFAVVADEVRKLAEKSTTATKEIADLIQGIQQTVAEAVNAMEAGAAEVENGASRTHEAGKALSAILNAIEVVDQQVKEISTAVQQMSSSSNALVSAMDTVSGVVEKNTVATRDIAAGSGEVSQAIDNIARVSGENSAAIEEVGAAAEEMSAQVAEVSTSAQSLQDMAHKLQALVSQFTLVETKRSQPDRTDKAIKGRVSGKNTAFDVSTEKQISNGTNGAGSKGHHKAGWH
ncbi:MAG: methyl-accepting chemotaxis protein [Anaerolineae bacterium]|nr:methyl-accepting chemotaxis protein [Anaerolineae bacterium]